jgi:hypothetical protein
MDNFLHIITCISMVLTFDFYSHRNSGLIHGWVSHFVSNKGTSSIETLRFGSNFAIWQLTPDFLAKLLHVSRFVQNKILFCNFFTMSW